MAKVVERLLRRHGYVREDALTVGDVARICHREGIRVVPHVEPDDLLTTRFGTWVKRQGQWRLNRPTKGGV